MEQLSSEPSPQRNNSANVLYSTDLSGMHTREMPTLSPVTCSEPDFVTVDGDSNDSTFPYRFGAKQPNVPPSSNDLSLPPNPINALATMAVVQVRPTQHDKNYNPQSPEPSEPSPTSTPVMNLSTIDGWETPYSTTDYNTFYSDGEPRRVHWNSPLDETFHSEGEPRRIYLLPVHPRYHRLAR